MGKLFSDLFFDLKDTFPRLPPRLELLLQLLLLLLVEDVVLNRIDALPKLDISLQYCCWWWWGLWRWWRWQHAFCYSLPLTQDVWWGLPCTGEGNGCKLYLKNLPKIQFLVRDKKTTGLICLSWCRSNFRRRCFCATSMQCTLHNSTMHLLKSCN